MVFGVLLVAFFGLTAFLLFSNYLSTPTPNVATNQPDYVAQRDLPIPKDLGVETLDDPRLSDLELHGRFPIEKGQVGNTNPFVQPATAE